MPHALAPRTACCPQDHCAAPRRARNAAHDHRQTNRALDEHMLGWSLLGSAPEATATPNLGNLNPNIGKEK
eukprot:11157418-Lingulodinium_polyedra.AAC.1